MRDVLKQRNFTLLWLGGLISMIGNWVLMAAMPFYVYDLTGSALATSGIMMAFIAPGIVFSSVAGVFVDRWDRRKTMIVTALLQGVVVMLMIVVNSVDQIWILYIAIFIEASLSRFFHPAENALLPTLVGEEYLMQANSLNALNDNLARLVGPAIGGALLGLVGFSSVVIIDAASYIIAAVLIFLVSAPAKPVAAAPVAEIASVTSPWVKAWKEWVAGISFVRAKRPLAIIFLITTIAMFGDAILSAVLVVFVQDSMGLGAVEFGWMMTARGIGGLLGGLLIAQIGSRMSPNQFIRYGLFVTGLLILAAVQFPTLIVVLPILVLAGITGIPWIVGIQTLVQTLTPDNFRGRVFGAFGAIVSLLMLVGSGLGGALADQIGIDTLMSVAALIYVAAGVVAWLLMARSTPVTEPVASSG